MESIFYILMFIYIWIYMIYCKKRDLIKNVKIEDLSYY